MKKITDITRKDIIDIITNGFYIKTKDEDGKESITEYQMNRYGRVSEIEFLNRIYKLREMPTSDRRFPDAEGDIYQHTVNNYDWEDDWVFSDSRFHLGYEDEDEPLLKYICEIFHPVVRYEEGPWKLYIDKINQLLKVDGYEIYEVDHISGRMIYSYKETDKILEVQIPKVNEVDREYLKNLSSRAISDIDNGDNDSAITKARTILEETFCYVIEKKQETPDQSGDINKMYKQVRDLYNMHTDKNMDARINKLLSGLNSIVSSIGEMRNKNSDSHGVGKRRINLADYHARLAVNSTLAMAEFVLSVCESQISNNKL